MPKGKNSKKRGGGKTEEAVLPGGNQRNEDELADNWSTYSAQSDDTHGSWNGSAHGATEAEEDEETAEQENFEDKFMDCLDLLTAKSASTRVKALTSIQMALRKNYKPDFFSSRQETLVDALLRCLRKGKADEQALAADCVALVALILEAQVEDLMTSAVSVLTSIMSDNATAPKARSHCAQTLAIITFFSVYDHEVSKGVVASLEDVVRLGYGAGENSPSLPPARAALVAAALEAWALLLTVAPAFVVDAAVKNHLGRLQELLEAGDLDLRLAAGETIALMYELARDQDEDFEHDAEENLCELLKGLATDSAKHRAKKDRCKQRACFRDVQKSIMDRESMYECHKIGKDQQLEIDSWSQKLQYEICANVLAQGMQIHLRVNPVLRAVFDLGPPGCDEYSQTRNMSKAQRALVNAAAFKARTKARAKHRDKRAITMSSGY